VWGVEVGDCVGLVAYEIVEAVCAVGVDEAVADPGTRAYAAMLSVPIITW
jgi:hypothetical protein